MPKSKPINPATMPMRRSPHGSPYRGEVVEASLDHYPVSTARSVFACIVVMRVTEPVEYEGRTVVHAIVMDPDEPMSWANATSEFDAAGLTPTQMGHGDIPALLRYKRPYFNYRPASKDLQTREYVRLVKPPAQEAQEETA